MLLMTGVVIRDTENQQSIYFKGNHITAVQMVQEVKMKPFLPGCCLGCCNTSYTVLLKGVFENSILQHPKGGSKSAQSQQSQISLS